VARSRARERELARRRYERRRLRDQQLRARRRRRNQIIGAVVGTLAVIGGLVALIVSLAGGGSGKKTTSLASSPTPTASATSSAVPAAPTACAKISPNPPAAGDPVVPDVTGKPPTTLLVKDIKVGKGAAARTGQTLTLNYVGVSCSTGKAFDASYPRKQPFSFPLGKGQVIKGWDQGLVGMRVGGRRELVIPASLGYGAAGSGATIKPNETLIFVVDLVSAK
jgi:peptidylprolyl isomerase